MENIVGNSLMSKKIGILSKNYQYVEETLLRNIGNGSFDFDGIGTPISQVGDPYLTSRYTPWFYSDEKKKSYPTYLSYVNDTYFNGWATPLNTESIDDRIAHFDRNSLLFINNRVGVIRNYDMDNPNGILNMNGYDDTKLGMINNFYLSQTLQHARMMSFNRGSYTIPSYNGVGSYLNSNITQGAYVNFGFEGYFGIRTGEYHSTDGIVRPNEVYTWNILNKNVDGATFDYDTLNFSADLYYASGGRTQDLIAKSMMGIDLLRTDIRATLEEDMNLGIKKYYATIGNKGRSYISAMSTDIEGNSSGKVELVYDADGNRPIRYKFLDMGNDNSSASRRTLTYAEMENGDVPSKVVGTNLGVEYNTHEDFSQFITNTNDIIYYTNRQFRSGKYDTIISRFHTEGYKSAEDARKLRSQIESANSQFGLSHGRNLLKVKGSEVFDDKSSWGYSNPYCRVWTHHHQYNQLIDTIRPFYDIDDKGKATLTDISSTEVVDYHIQENQIRLRDYGVKQSNGLVRITPTLEVDSKGNPNKGENVKRCMFSIENLAWKGGKQDQFDGNFIGEKGPRGGRIMWFPPYDLRFSENVGVNWSQNQFIGRGESIYTYTNTERSGNLSFKLLIDHPSIINKWRNEVKGTTQDVDDVNSTEQKLLRFFAGCEKLAPYQPKPKQDDNKLKVDSEPKLEPVTTQTKTSKEVYFYVFFPNNYSGVDDLNGLIKPIDYIANGLGCNLLENTKEDVTPFEVRWDQIYRGYEMGNSTDVNQSGISFGSHQLNSLELTKVTIGGVKYPLATHWAVNRVGNDNYWGYRVDKSTEKEILNNSNYCDYSDYGLNNSGYTKLLTTHTDAQSFKEDLYSFTDVLVALHPYANLIYDEVTPGAATQLREMLGGVNEEWEVINVEIAGFASSYGHTKSNNKLSKHRARTIQKWLQSVSKSFENPKLFKITETDIGQLKKPTLHVNDLEAKIWCCARVKISLVQTETIIKAPQQSNVLPLDAKLMTYNKINLPLSNKHIGSADGKDRDSATKVDFFSSWEDEERTWRVRADEGQKNSTASQDNVSDGYGKEYEFFQELEANMPFLHSKIVDKIKYFDPAFHSITPEGFNSRLTFLHQCTRQGSTYGDSNGSFSAAGNLAFGAPPICVLRIGDFYNTKIIIDSLQIDYDDTTWDLNDEGIGVMPMMANITISFKFIGGSDLSGPISRLQNAVSFNYYANTNVYDPRADVVEYNNDGSIKDLKVNN